MEGRIAKTAAPEEENYLVVASETVRTVVSHSQPMKNVGEVVHSLGEEE